MGRHAHHPHNLALREVSGNHFYHISVVCMAKDVVKENDGVDVVVVEVAQRVETTHSEDVIVEEADDEFVEIIAVKK